jgi:hypothetical protein
MFIFQLLPKTRRASKTLWLLIPVALSALTVSAILDGRFNPNQEGFGLVELWLYDFGNLIGINDGSRSFPEFFLLRDTATLFLVCLQVGNIVVLFRQWMSFRDFLPESIGSGVLRIRSREERTRVLRLVTSTNRSFHIIGRTSGLIFLAVLGGSIFVYQGLGRTDLFKQFAPASPGAPSCTDLFGQLVAFSDCSFENWWATGHSGKYVFGGFTTLFFYFLTLQNLVGVRLCWFLFRIRNSFLLQPSPIPQIAYGLAPIAAVFRSVYYSLSLNLISLVTLLLVIQGNQRGNLSFGLGLFAFGVIVYVPTPIMVLNHIRRRTARLYCRIYCAYPNARTEGSLRLLAELPTIPVRTKPVKVFVLAVVPALVAAYQTYLWLFVPA